VKFGALQETNVEFFSLIIKLWSNLTCFLLSSAVSPHDSKSYIPNVSLYLFNRVWLPRDIREQVTRGCEHCALFSDLGTT